MSMYRGKTETLKPVFENGAWMIYDDHGPFDGPYESEGAAWSAIHARAKWERENVNTYAGYVGRGL